MAYEAHPMDEIIVRPLRFQFGEQSTTDPVWSQSSPLFAIFANAFTLHVPYFERYLVRTLGKAKRKITDSALIDDVERIIEQEAHHAHNFIGFNEVLKGRYPKAAPLERAVSKDFAQRLKTEDFKTLVGFTAGYETFTFLAGLIFLDNYDKWFADSDPAVKALWVWHQVEEVEHAAVAFDVYKYFYKDDEKFRRKMIRHAYRHIVRETWKAYWHMCKVEGYLSSPKKAFDALAFITKTFSIMMWLVRPVFKKDYHPRNHPLATTDQNPIAVSWRRFHKKGGDVLEIDHEKIREIMQLS